MLFLKAPQPVWQFRLSTHRSSSLVCLFIFQKEPTASLQRLKGRGGRPKKDHQGVWGPGAAGWAPAEPAYSPRQPRGRQRWALGSGAAASRGAAAHEANAKQNQKLPST